MSQRKTQHLRAKGWLVGGLAAVVVADVSGCGGQTVLQRDQVQYPQAVHLYQNGCITCHGNNLQGGIGPNLQHVGADMTVSRIEQRIAQGKGAMPAYALPGDRILTTAQIRTLAQWLAAKR